MGVNLGADFLAAVRTVPYGYAVTPPELAGNTPVLYVLHPVVIYLCKAFGNEGNFLVRDRVYCGAGELFHFYEPLFGNKRLDCCAATVAMTDVMRVGFDFYERAAIL